MLHTHTLLHTAACTQGSFDTHTQKLLHKRVYIEAFTQRSLYTEELLHREAF